MAAAKKKSKKTVAKKVAKKATKKAAAKKSPRIGRPRLPKGKQKSRVVAIRVTPAEYKAVGAKAKAKDQKLSVWAREALGVDGSAD